MGKSSGGRGRSSGGSRSANNQRSNVKNPNNPAYKAAMNNRSNQSNPNNASYESSRGPSARGGKASTGGSTNTDTGTDTGQWDEDW